MTNRSTNANGARELVAAWRYRVRPAKTEAFMHAYGADGAWVELFRRGEGYISTELLRDALDPAVFVTIDRWESRIAYDAFRKRFAEEYLALDSVCAAYTEDEELLLEGSGT
ncbi:MAG TPA: antibiotic biosynthesis monooxygenase family protein [Opitutaceae bacterium]|nr:antibiotic biosynthesis monooxygenase family protein [Opitutaceae bacterium]